MWGNNGVCAAVGSWSWSQPLVALEVDPAAQADVEATQLYPDTATGVAVPDEETQWYPEQTEAVVGTQLYPEIGWSSAAIGAAVPKQRPLPPAFPTAAAGSHAGIEMPSTQHYAADGQGNATFGRLSGLSGAGPEVVGLEAIAEPPLTQFYPSQCAAAGVRTAHCGSPPGASWHPGSAGGPVESPGSSLRFSVAATGNARLPSASSPGAAAADGYSSRKEEEPLPATQTYAEPPAAHSRWENSPAATQPCADTPQNRPAQLEGSTVPAATQLYTGTPQNRSRQPESSTAPNAGQPYADTPEHRPKQLEGSTAPAATQMYLDTPQNRTQQLDWGMDALAEGGGLRGGPAAGSTASPAAALPATQCYGQELGKECNVLADCEAVEGASVVDPQPVSPTESIDSVSSLEAAVNKARGALGAACEEDIGLAETQLYGASPVDAEKAGRWAGVSCTRPEEPGDSSAHDEQVSWTVCQQEQPYLAATQLYCEGLADLAVPPALAAAAAAAVAAPSAAAAVVVAAPPAP
eukprot:CAMPEP_0179047970 /NCGR_PEP_ID=MMETSP0796-20121207/19470_1 /TAXON_ID=73915 /ORGANISM="Pyrodinium bahamense, Strain pbaha01" /LENGTH=521 /DNA_ID=CAMNT_0020744429 /DNA_START=37 /DNA_END=1600 /DNA_ORIENTATION=+